MRRWRTPIGYMDHFDAGHHPKQFTAEMAQVSGPARTQVYLARIRLGVSDELGDRLGRERRIRQQDESIVVDARDRNDVARDGDGALLIERHVDGVRRGEHQQGVAVSRRACDRLQGEIAAAARPVVDNHRLAEPLRQRMTNESRDDVGRAAGGNEDDQSHWPGRIGLRPSGAPAARRKNCLRGRFI